MNLADTPLPPEATADRYGRAEQQLVDRLWVAPILVALAGNKAETTKRVSANVSSVAEVSPNV